MAWSPAYPNLAGVLPILQNARAIIEQDFADALAWAYGVNESGGPYARIQYTQRHSQAFPLLVIQPATSSPAATGQGGVLQSHVFDVEIYLTRAISAGNPSDSIDQLPQDLIRYLDATMMAFLSAPASAWRTNLGTDQGAVGIWCTNIVFGQLQQAKEAAGNYLHSVAFELQVDLLESA